MKQYPMRRKERQLGDEETLQIIKNGEYGILSLKDDDGTPYGVPLNYCCAEGKIYFHGTNEGGHKAECIGEGCLACFTVVGPTEILPGEFGTKFSSAMVFGRITPVKERKEKEFALQGLLHKYSETFWNKGLAFIGSCFDKVGVWRLAIEYMTGKARK